MINLICKAVKDIHSYTDKEYLLQTNEATHHILLPIPDSVYELLISKYHTDDFMFKHIEDIQVDLDFTDLHADEDIDFGELSAMEPKELLEKLMRAINYNTQSILYGFTVNNNNSIDEQINDCLESVEEYEQYHILYMDMEKGKIHAYIKTPKDGILKSKFSRALRDYAYNNNIIYWVDNYNITVSSAGGKSVSPLGNPTELGPRLS